jgi:hypothetical protein
VIKQDSTCKQVNNVSLVKNYVTLDTSSDTEHLWYCHIFACVGRIFLWPWSASEPCLLGKLVANFCGQRMLRGQRDRPYSWFSRPELLLFLSSSSSVALTRLSGPCSRPITSQRIWWRRESNLGLWICSRNSKVGLTTLAPSMSRLSRQRGIPNILQTYRPPRPLTGKAFTFTSG